MNTPRSLATAFAAASLLALAVATAATAAEWTVNQEKSTLGFTATQGGSEVIGTFESWTAEIDFDPAAPGSAKIRTVIDLASVVTGEPQVDGQITGEAWFNTGEHPQAVFEAASARQREDGVYEAEGSLTINGVSLPITVPFTLEIDGDTASAKGEMEILRDKWSVGEGFPESTVGTAVKVSFEVTAQK
ncbi:polyisoprenoid-binding protein [Stappia sp. GBMRC 2046]|uniref:Polyisoprenoid-binding protein n=1 Tax=Stappia sediminis TaxID=2692190 RepID=A0A7X3LY68_9HYPH|nr:YceI family protein [Stappia sediminis]MXN67253.1 polyisoprenoid-binding protein [Stappia sediminis]